MTVALVESGRTAKRHRLSSILLKQVMAITGVIFVSFVFIHMFGNLKVYQGPEAFNHYAGWLREVGYPLIPKKRLTESPSTLRARAALMPPCAATEWARRGESWKVKTSTW